MYYIDISHHPIVPTLFRWHFLAWKLEIIQYRKLKRKTRRKYLNLYDLHILLFRYANQLCRIFRTRAATVHWAFEFIRTLNPIPSPPFTLYTQSHTHTHTRVVYTRCRRPSCLPFCCWQLHLYNLDIRQNPYFLNIRISYNIIIYNAAVALKETQICSRTIKYILRIQSYYTVDCCVHVNASANNVNMWYWSKWRMSSIPTLLRRFSS